MTSQAHITSQANIAPQAPAGTARTTLCFYLHSFTSQANITSQASIASQAPAGTARATLCFYVLSFTSQASINSQGHGEGQQVTHICVTCCLASTTTRIVILLLLHALSQAFISITIMRPQSWQWHRRRGLRGYVVSLRHRAGDLGQGSAEVS